MKFLGKPHNILIILVLSVPVSADDRDQAVAELEAIAATGFASVGFIANGPILGTLEGDERYDSIVSDMSRAAYPCEYDEAFSEFDFRVGEWVQIWNAEGGSQINIRGGMTDDGETWTTWFEGFYTRKE